MTKITWGIFSPFHPYVKEKANWNIREAVSTDTHASIQSSQKSENEKHFWFCISPVQVSAQFQGIVSAILWIFSVFFYPFIFERKYSPWFIWLESPFPFMGPFLLPGVISLHLSFLAFKLMQEWGNSVTQCVRKRRPAGHCCDGVGEMGKWAGNRLMAEKKQ